jgi:hypothetical protein
MNPIARLEEIRAARQRSANFAPPDSPNSPNSLPETGDGGADNRDNRVNRVGDNPQGANRLGEEPTARQSGELGESGGVAPEKDGPAQQRWGLAPTRELPVSLLEPRLLERDAGLLVSHFTRQPVAVGAWILAQAARYGEAVPQWATPAAHEHAAALDCLLWQWEQVLTPPDQAGRYDRVQEAVRKLRGLEDAARDAAAFFQWTKGQPAPPAPGEPKESMTI